MSALVGTVSLAPGESIGLFALTGATTGNVYSVSVSGNLVRVVANAEDTSSFELVGPYLTDSEILVKNFGHEHTTVAALAVPTGIEGTSSAASSGSTILQAGESIGLLEVAGVDAGGIYSVSATGRGLSIVDGDDDGKSFPLTERHEYVTNGEILVKNFTDGPVSVSSVVVPTVMGGGGSGGGGAVDSVNGKTGAVVLTATDVDAKPADYEPDLTGLVEDDDPRLSDSRTPLAHTHTISQVTGLQDALGDKADFDDIPTGPGDIGAAPASHTHSIAQVTGLQAALEDKADSSEIPTSPSDIGAATAAQGDKADTAVQPDNLRLPILLTQAEYDGLTPVEGQIYIIQG